MATKSWNQLYVLCPFFLYDDGKREIAVRVFTIPATSV